jgi:hypothetical protein
MEALGKICVYVVLMIVSVFTDGYTLSKGWQWFVSDTFGVMQLGMLQAVGLAMLLKHATTKLRSSDLDKADTDTMETTLKLFFVAQVINVFFLVVGFIIKSCI